MSLTDRLKDKLYKGVALVEQKGAKGIAKMVVQEGKDIHRAAQEQGGYIAAVQNNVNSVVEAVTDRYDKMHQSIDTMFLTDGKYDSTKAKQVLADKTELVKQYGVKAGTTLYNFAKSSPGAILADYRAMVPEPKDIKDKYAGIGSKYKGGLLVKDLDACVEFYNQAQELIPNKNLFKSAVLEDIKASASANSIDLIEFYKDTRETNYKKDEIVDNYLVIKQE